MILTCASLRLKEVFNFSTKILVVDDMPTMRKVMVKACKDLGFVDITEAVDGIDAWTKISQSEPSFGVVISDWEMPRCTGMDLFKRLHSDSRFSKFPFVMVTLEAEKQQFQTALKAGVSACMVKPFTSAGLGEMLELIHKNFSKG